MMDSVKAQKPYAVYDLVTGSVLYTGVSSYPELQGREGFGVVVGEARPDRDFVDLAGPEPVITPLDQATLDASEFERAKKLALHAANKLVGNARATVITDIPGQDAIYQSKLAEARAFANDPAPDMSRYPLLSAEVGVTAATAGELAALWERMNSQWAKLAASMEAARFRAGAAIRQAATTEEVEAATQQLEVDLAAMLSAAR